MPVVKPVAICCRTAGKQELAVYCAIDACTRLTVSFGSDIHARPLTLPRVFRAGSSVVVIATACPSAVICALQFAFWLDNCVNAVELVNSTLVTKIDSFIFEHHGVC